MAWHCVEEDQGPAHHAHFVTGLAGACHHHIGR